MLMANFLRCNDKKIAIDKDGYLKDLGNWNENVAEALAADCQINLKDAHWEIIWLVREFYQQHQLSPPMRPLIKLVKTKLGDDKGRSIYLMKLFGGSAAKTLNRIAGLPRPANCL